MKTNLIAYKRKNCKYILGGFFHFMLTFCLTFGRTLLSVLHCTCFSYLPKSITYGIDFIFMPKTSVILQFATPFTIPHMTAKNVTPIRNMNMRHNYI